MGETSNLKCNLFNIKAEKKGVSWSSPNATNVKLFMSIFDNFEYSISCFISKENQAIKLSQLGTRGPNMLNMPFF